jgi:hypothetical protein
VNEVEILYTHELKWKNVETIPEIGGGRIKENDGRRELNYNIW